MPSRYIDRYYENDFLIGLSQSIDVDTGDNAHVKEFLDKEKIDFSQDLSILENATQVGPKFDIRYAGGAYKIESNPIGVSELFVHSVDRKIFVDGVEVKSQTNDNGRISFATASNHAFEVTFDCVVGRGISVDLSERSFIGQVHPADSPNEPFKVTGKLYFPWEEGLIGLAGIKGSSAADTARESEALKYFAVALDLVRNPSDIVIDEDLLIDVAPAQGPPMTTKLMTNPLDEGLGGDSRKKKSMFRKSKIAQHAINLTPAMVTIAVGAGLGALFAPPAIALAPIGAIVAYSGNQMLHKVRKVYQNKLSDWLKLDLELKSEAVKEMLDKAVSDVFDAQGTEKRRSADLVNDTLERLKEGMQERIHAEMYRKAAEEFPGLFRTSKKEFLKGFNKGVNDWIARNHSDAELFSDARAKVEERVEKDQISSELDLRLETLRRETNKLKQEKEELIKEMTDSSKHTLPENRGAHERDIKELDTEFDKDLEKIKEKISDSSANHDSDLAKDVHDGIDGMRERIKKLQEEHYERGHTHL